MSFWTEITDPEDIDLSEDGREVHICYNTDNQGAYYISVDREMLLKAIKIPIHDVDNYYK